MVKHYKTKTKEILYSFFEQQKGKRFCAKDIMDYIEKENISINQATVYRNLDKLSAEGVLIKNKQADDENCYYQYVGEDNHCNEHLHIQCKLCGKIVHLENPELDEFYNKVQTEHGYILEFKESLLVGLCSECRN